MENNIVQVISRSLVGYHYFCQMAFGITNRLYDWFCYFVDKKGKQNPILDLTISTQVSNFVTYNFVVSRGEGIIKSQKLENANNKHQNAGYTY